MTEIYTAFVSLSLYTGYSWTSVLFINAGNDIVDIRVCQALGTFKQNNLSDNLLTIIITSRR